MASTLKPNELANVPSSSQQLDGEQKEERTNAKAEPADHRLVIFEANHSIIITMLFDA